MLQLSLFERISNIANIMRLVTSKGAAIASQYSFTGAESLKAYFLEPNHIKVCERQSVNNYSSKINNNRNDWQLEPKLNSGENARLIAILK